MPRQPPRVYAHDMPLSELRTAEILLVATLRHYAAAWWKTGTRDWREGLATIGPDAVDGFGALFDLVVAMPRRKLDIGCVHCRTISPDEGRLLQLVGLLQRRRGEDASALLADWLPPAGARLAFPHARKLAETLARHGLIVPPRNCLDAASPLTQPGPAVTLH